MVRRLLLAVLMLGMVTATAHAGIYVGASAGESKLNTTNFSDGDTSWKVYGGWTFLKFLGLEASYLDLGSPKDSGATISLTGSDLYIMGHLPLGKHLEIFGKVGYLFWNSDTKISGSSSSDSGNDMAYGAGVAWKFGEHLRVRGEYERFDVSNTDSVYLTSIGADFRF